jgi:predicted metal-dependent phosphotriesterase family hydrolase
MSIYVKVKTFIMKEIYVISADLVTLMPLKKTLVRGYTYIPEVFIPLLIRDEIEETLIGKLLVENPARAFKI